MTLVALLQISALAVLSFFAAFAALRLAARSSGPRAAPAGIFHPEEDETAIFMFDEDFLVNATEAAERIMLSAAEGENDWQRLLKVLEPRFPQIGTLIGELPERGRFVLRERGGQGRLLAQWCNGLARITLSEGDESERPLAIDRAAYEAMEAELHTLRLTAEHAPFLVWRQDAGGSITWANNAYLELARKLRREGSKAAWPPPRLFDLPPAAPETSASEPRRVSISPPGSADPQWFEVHVSRLEDGELCMAVQADRLVKAETTLRDFIQTLTKTFAHLTVGLAIFDKQRRLTLFNPALADLTSLPVEFLSSRPTLQEVLDRLREKKMIPEPKDYRSWRARLQALEAAAENGQYSETWSLANGSTYRVSGRPHPDGAVAFLFEDISAEISLTRRFRAQLDTGQAVLDSLGEAIAVFSASGRLVLSNAAYNRLWGIDAESEPPDFGIKDAVTLWTSHSAPTAVWSDVQAFISALGERKEWSADVRLLDGRRLHCRFTPISGGGTLVGFSTNAQRLEAHPVAPMRRLTFSESREKAGAP